MKIYSMHRWDMNTREAMALQSKLKEKILLKNSFRSIKEIHRVAGCDLALDIKSNLAWGGVVVYSFPDLEVVERRIIVQKLSFPYVPGLLSFREGPVLLKAIGTLETIPDLFIFDGQGIAHPRGIGIASHLALFLKKPTIGCAKSRLCGTFREPGPKRGDSSPLHSKEGKTMGRVLRTRDRVKPIFVSPGNEIDTRTAVRIIMKCCDGYRIPKPTREADHFVEAQKRMSLQAS